METKSVSSLWLGATLTVRLLRLLRVVVSLCVLLIVFVALHEDNDRSVALKVVALINVSYSAAIYLSSLILSERFAIMDRFSVWIDLLFFAYFIFAIRGASPVLLGSILITSMVVFLDQSQLIRLTATVLAAVILCTRALFDFGSGSLSTGVDADKILVLGFACFLVVMAFLSTARNEDLSIFRRRLELLGEAGELANPRFGVERTLNMLLEKLRDFYESEQCLLISREERDSDYVIWRATNSTSATATKPQAVAYEFARQLLAVPETHAVVLSRSGTLFGAHRYAEFDVLDGCRRVTNPLTRPFETLSEILETESILSVPIFGGDKVKGRLFLTSKRPNAFSLTDPAFLSDFISKVMPVIDALRLIDSFASSARERERQKIARDIHDIVVQPYVGIQLGLGAIRHKIQTGDEITTDLEKLLEMTDLEIYGLRSFVAELSSEIKHHKQFLPAVRQLAERFSATTGIAVEVKSLNEAGLNDRLAEQAFQMIAEGLSNVRRHTKASRVLLEIECSSRDFQLRISNNGSGEEAATPGFVPKSITSRTVSLGGNVSIYPGDDGATIVSITIPLW